jgi:hypothetical protein
MTRRQILRITAAGGAWALLCGHSPYRQFHLYRKTRLIILYDKRDVAAGSVGEALARLLSKYWPDSNAMTARAYDSLDLVTLIASKQLDLALLAHAQAAQARSGRGEFAQLGAVALTTLASVGGYSVVCREELLEPVARKFAEALRAHWEELDPALRGAASGPDPGSTPAIPIHAAALAAYRRRAPS